MGADMSGMQSRPGNLRDKVDRGLLHEYLWKHRDRRNMMTGSQNELAEKIGIGKVAMSLILKEMAEKGMLIKHGQGKWEVVDPEAYLWEHSPDDDGRLF